MGTQFPLPQRGEHPEFSAHICCGQMAGWIKIPLGMEVGLGPRDFVRWRPRPSPKKGRHPQIFGPCLLWPNGWMDQDGTWDGGRPQPRRLYVSVRWGPSPLPLKGAQPQFSVHVYCGQRAGWMKTPLGTDVDLGTGHIVLDGDTVRPRERGIAVPSLFGSCLLWSRSPFSATGSLLLSYCSYSHRRRLLYLRTGANSEQ